MNYFNYFSEIEETFNRRRGKFQFLSPVDWVLMEDWEKRGVPLHIVLRGIEKVFDSYDAKQNKRRSVKGLTYCREEIEAQYEEWAERQIGKNQESTAENPEDETFSDESVKHHIGQIIDELKTIGEKFSVEFSEILEKVIFRLKNLRENYSNAENAESELSRLEEMIDDFLLKDSDKQIISEAQKKTEKNLAEYKSKMEKEAYQRTFDLMMLKILREHYGVPRLSLFYL